jgi:hypothetical protein
LKNPHQNADPRQQVFSNILSQLSKIQAENLFEETASLSWKGRGRTGNKTIKIGDLLGGKRHKERYN